jgi:hypothetical protein
VNDSRKGPPPRHFGDHPDGAYWSADPPGPHDLPDDDDATVHGDTIRFMWDYGVMVPLWDGRGLLPSDPAWLRAQLGLSASLIDDLMAWGSAMGHLDGHPPLRTAEAFDDLDRRARGLAVRLQAEVGSRFTVRYEPW